MSRALPLTSAGSPVSGTGFFARLRAWLAALRPLRAPDQPRFRAPPAETASAAPCGQLVAFPVRSDALLVKLAELLRSRIAACSPRHDPFLLALSREPWSRLHIDQASYVEVEPGRAVYRLNVELAPVTVLIIETTDFDQIVRFVVEYVNDRLADASAMSSAT
jgi:hypothetical protein